MEDSIILTQSDQKTLRRRKYFFKLMGKKFSLENCIKIISKTEKLIKNTEIYFFTFKEICN